MTYLLISDNCETCNYITNAFTLLQLPLTVVAPSDLEKKINHVPAVVIACKEIEISNAKTIYDIINATHSSLISFNILAKSHKSILIPANYLKMPFTKYELKTALLNASSNIKNVDQSAEEINFQNSIFTNLVGQSESIFRIKKMIQQVAYSNTNILIQGPSGTGKDVIASCIHSLSPRNQNPYVPINCGAIPSELMESELFGHEKGAFTGALSRRVGRFEIANTGTLFLDEIGDMPLQMQVKLLRVIQDRQIQRVGGNNYIDVDVKIIAATNKNLKELVEKNLFREDLYYRLNVFPIEVPSLKERYDDIPLLIEFYLDKIYKRLTHKISFTESAKKLLSTYTWPGNIRELQNYLERMIILYPDEIIDEKNINLTIDNDSKMNQIFHAS